VVKEINIDDEITGLV